jgi:uncharacterized coiled-coil protein SlyX
MRPTAAIVALTVGALVASGALATTAPGSRQELDELKAQLAALQQRLAELESAHARVAAKAETLDEVAVVNAEQQESIDRTIDTLAQTRAGIGPWVSAFNWKGDLRYRNETIDQANTLTERNRDRIRARFGFVAKVNETVRVEVQAATTEGFDSRSSNQTLTNANSRKALDLDVAYAEWAPNAQWKLTAGKMKYPWVRTSSYFYDGDINPEGVAVAWQAGATGPFASVFYTHLAERATQADSNLLGAQVGWRGVFGDGGRFAVAAGYFDHGGVEGYNPFLDANATNAFGNTTTANAAICRRAVAVCLANDYDVIDVMGELQFNLAGRPLTLFAQYARNSAADFAAPSNNPVLNAPAGLDTAYAAGFNYGRASEPGTWEIGFLYQRIEKDAMFAQWIDSDFAAGNTDGGGSAVRFAYAFARNWRVNVTYMMTDTNNDVAAAVVVPTPQAVFDRDYRRIQVDLNMDF